MQTATVALPSKPAHSKLNITISITLSPDFCLDIFLLVGLSCLQNFMPVGSNYKGIFEYTDSHCT